MTIGLSIIWIIFAVLFLLLGRFYWYESKRKIPPFKLTERKFSRSDSPIHVSISAAGTPLDQPLEDFAVQFNAYLEEQNSISQKTNLRAAFGYYLAAATALFSVCIEWYDIIAPLLTKK
ncbi:MAG: hypothetical protein IMZ53_01825 [Thermoplasmata archaeon]|nr:hypothetical protein [Thermoplasmata archaeon]